MSARCERAHASLTLPLRFYYGIWRVFANVSQYDCSFLKRLSDEPKITKSDEWLKSYIKRKEEEEEEEEDDEPFFLCVSCYGVRVRLSDLRAVCANRSCAPAHAMIVRSVAAKIQICINFLFEN